jgi:putative addiction module component (TIGR02574 family)
MTAIMDKVMNDIQTLTPSEKGFLVQYVISSLDTQQDENSNEEWELLAKKRYEEIETGKTQAESWDNIKQQIGI